ncbi:MAG: 50S ribosomal protein L9 [Clostridiaceae bacterium]|nr:50S ribosomal protein L9 [Clostridiaceae bacterium]
MKVILLVDIKSVGKKGEVINASDGYARNFLLPKKFAQEATDATLHILNQKSENERKKKLSEIEAAQKQAEQLKNKKIEIVVKAGEGGRLFGAITTKDIAEKIKTQYNLDIDKKKITANTIKNIGTYEVEIKLYAEVSTKMTVVVIEK